jgi:hypothetical protein
MPESSGHDESGASNSPSENTKVACSAPGCWETHIVYVRFIGLFFCTGGRLSHILATRRI